MRLQTTRALAHALARPGARKDLNYSRERLLAFPRRLTAAAAKNAACSQPARDLALLSTLFAHRGGED